MAKKFKSLGAERLNEFILENKITQKDLGESICISAQSITRVMSTGIMTKRIAKAIADLKGKEFVISGKKVKGGKEKPPQEGVFSEMRYEYLMGLDDYKTEKQLLTRSIMDNTTKIALKSRYESLEARHLYALEKISVIKKEIDLYEEEKAFISALLEEKNERFDGVPAQSTSTLTLNA